MRRLSELHLGSCLMSSGTTAAIRLGREGNFDKRSSIDTTPLWPRRSLDHDGPTPLGHCQYHGVVDMGLRQVYSTYSEWRDGTNACDDNASHHMA